MRSTATSAGSGRPFGLAIRTRLANRGSECDNDGNASSLTPLTNPSFWNMTYIGAGVQQANSEVNDGPFLRRNGEPDIQNAIIANFGNVGVVIDGTGSQAHATAGALVLDHILFFGNQALSSPAAQAATTCLEQNVNFRGGAESSYHIQGVAGAFDGNTFVCADPQFMSVNFADPINGTKPDPRPQAGSCADPSNAATRPDGIVGRGANYLGAFSGTDWTATGPSGSLRAHRGRRDADRRDYRAGGGGSTALPPAPCGSKHASRAAPRRGLGTAGPLAFALMALVARRAAPRATRWRRRHRARVRIEPLSVEELSSTGRQGASRTAAHGRARAAASDTVRLTEMMMTSGSTATSCSRRFRVPPPDQRQFETVWILQYPDSFVAEAAAGTVRRKGDPHPERPLRSPGPGLRELPCTRPAGSTSRWTATPCTRCACSGR